MKRLVSVCVLMLWLSFPAFAGHTTQGGFYCDCSDPEHSGVRLVLEDEEIQQNSTPTNEVSELDLLIDVMLALIRF